MDEITRMIKDGKLPMGIQAAPAQQQPARYDPTLPIENAVCFSQNGQPVIVGGVNNIEVIAREVFPECLHIIRQSQGTLIELGAEVDPDSWMAEAADMAVDCAVALKKSLVAKMQAEAAKAEQAANTEG